MPIVGFNIEKVEAAKTADITGKIAVKNNLAVREIKRQDLVVGKQKKEDGLRFEFEFSSIYEPNIGYVKILGYSLFMEPPEVVKKILDNWKKTKQVPQDIMSVLLNTILVRCNVKALYLEQEVGLPPHLRLPTISAGKPAASDYVG